MEPTEVGWISRLAGLPVERGPLCAAPGAGDAPREMVAGGWVGVGDPAAEAGGPGTWERVVVCVSASSVLMGALFAVARNTEGLLLVMVILLACILLVVATRPAVTATCTCTCQKVAPHLLPSLSHAPCPFPPLML